MTEKLEQDMAQSGGQLLDDAYMIWFAAECASESALRAWSQSAPGSSAGAYAAYRACLGREEAAARELQRVSALAQRGAEVTSEVEVSACE